MYKVQGYLEGKIVFDCCMEHLPRTGDTVRLSDQRTEAKVVEVCWHIDDDDSEGQRVYMWMKLLPRPHWEINTIADYNIDGLRRAVVVQQTVQGWKALRVDGREWDPAWGEQPYKSSAKYAAVFLWQRYQKEIRGDHP